MPNPAPVEAHGSVIRLVVEYDGTDFCGFQFQYDQRTVAGVLEEALSALLTHPVKVSSAGRTDAGVHATGQVVSFRTERDFPVQRMALALNSSLPQDVSVRLAEFTADDFSARFSARERTYIYAVFNRRMASALLNRYAYHYYGALDVELMERSAHALIGEHDFRSFCGMLPESGPTLRNVRAITVRGAGDIVRIEIRADGFLHRMVRNIIGTLLEIGNGRRDPESLRGILEARRREAAGHTAPAQGLYLAGVRYNDFDSFLEPAITR